MVFGLVTLFMSTSIIFNLFDIREIMGNYVLFVVIANFLCALLYLLAAYGIFKGKKWTTRVLFAAVLILVLTFIAFGIHIISDGIYEAKTVKAMIFRTLLTAGFLLISYQYISKEKKLKYGKIQSKIK